MLYEGDDIGAFLHLIGSCSVLPGTREDVAATDICSSRPSALFAAANDSGTEAF
ncbi:hypothetical protein [Atopobium sp. oral taxon 416]|uniref:hypothetical protein n=1 Tax=Atopobium sp. oral taxon 416 TaxID=712157 RepID=UPI001BACF393|nr:hypothetical protein [Atopobium sp. oral taxon 416]QUC02531.1 hypothetical protein J4859_10830 [Atopobium sp. oral taxon 416]